MEATFGCLLFFWKDVEENFAKIMNFFEFPLKK